MNEGMENLQQIEMLERSMDNTNRLLKIVDKLEQRIATLEKVLESHAKCIGAIRKICDE
jgi:exonuclease VII small subunit